MEKIKTLVFSFIYEYTGVTFAGIVGKSRINDICNARKFAIILFFEFYNLNNNEIARLISKKRTTVLYYKKKITKDLKTYRCYYDEVEKMKIKFKKNMENLKKAYNEAVNAYVNEFEKRFDVKMDFWMGDEIGVMAAFGDEYYSFEEIKFMVENEFDYNYIYDWFYFLFSFGEKCKINLKSYCKLRKDAEDMNEHFDLNEFEKKLIYDRVPK